MNSNHGQIALIPLLLGLTATLFLVPSTSFADSESTWGCDHPEAISAVQNQVQDTVVHVMEQSIKQYEDRFDEQTREQMSQHIETIKNQMDVQVDSTSVRSLDEHEDDRRYRACQARIVMKIEQQTRRMPVNYVLQGSGDETRVDVQWPDNLSRFNRQNRGTNGNCRSKQHKAKSVVSTVRTAIVQCQMTNDCNRTKLTTSNYGEFLTEDVIRQYELASSGKDVKSITRDDIGCEWSDDHGNRGRGMAYMVESGKFLAYSGDFQLNSGSNDKETTPSRNANTEAPIAFESFRVISQSDHRAKLKVDYRFNDQTIDRAYLNVSAMANGRRVWNGFESDGMSLSPPSGTATVELHYRTLNPQWDGQDPPAEIETTQIAVRALGGNIDTVEKRFPFEKTWSLHQPHKPSDNIPDDPSVNKIDVKSVEKVDSTTRRVHYTYNYRSDHGPAVHMSASALKDDENVSCCTHIDELQRGQHTNSTIFSRRVSEIRSHPVTDQLKLTMTIGISEEQIYSKTVDHRIDWSGTLDEPSDVYSPSGASSAEDTMNLSVLIDAMRRYEQLEKIPDRYVEQYLERARTRSQYESLLALYLERHRNQLRHNPDLFTEALELMKKATESVSTSSRHWQSRHVDQLFRKHRSNQPLYNGPFTDKMFRLMRQLVDDVESKSMAELSVPNLYTHQPGHPAIQIPDHFHGPSSNVNTIFVRIPENTYLESVYVDRILPEVSDQQYQSLFEDGFGRGQRATHRYYLKSGQQSQNLLSNSFQTENFWIPAQRSDLGWIRLSIPSLGQPSATHEINVHSIPLDDVNNRQKLRSWAPAQSFDQQPGPLSKWAEKVEKSRAMDHFQKWSPPDRKGTGYQILTGSFYLMSGKHDRAKQHLSTISYPDSDHFQKWMQMYGLLPLVDLSWNDFLDYRTATPVERIRLLRERDLSLPGQYSLGRELWQAGSFEKASDQFQQVLEQLEGGDVLRDEAKLYYVSSLYRGGKRQRAIEALSTYMYRTSDVRSGNQKPFSIEVEGIFTNGLPMRNYLTLWLEVMENGQRAWWYDKLGTAEEPIRSYRYFATTFEKEPVGHLAANAFRDASRASAAYMNHKGIRGEIDNGPIRRNELFLVLPWNNRIHTYMMEPPNEVSRKAVKRNINAIPRPPNPIRGRGPGANYYTGTLEVDSVVDRLLERSNSSERIPLISMPEFLSRFAEPETPVNSDVSFRRETKTDREMLEQYIKKHSPIQSPELPSQ